MTDHIDILLYLALSEEADSVLGVLGDGFKPEEFSSLALIGFFGTLRSSSLHRDFRVAVVPAGKMGNTRAANVVSALIGILKPADVVVIGIAGSLSNDMEPGDVFIPDSVNEYLANAAAVGEQGPWKFVTSGNNFLTSVRLLNRFQFFAHSYKMAHQSWQADTRALREAIIPATTEVAMKTAGLESRGACKLFAGDDRKLASGPAVGKGTAFIEWIMREVDRKASAIEMESAGVYDAAILRTPAPRTVSIRGISDYADERKEKIEKTAKGKFRDLSAKNAVALFIRAVEAGVFGPDDASASNRVDPRTSDNLVSKAKSIFVIGGITGETADVDAETPRLNHACLKLGAALAHAGAQLLICSPFPDSADYYTAMGYADAKAGGEIHFHSPIHAKVEEKRNLLRQSLGQPNLTIQDWNYPGPEGDNGDSWYQAWLLAQLQALDKADVVVALGGKVSKTANTLLHLAEAKGIPIVPFAFLGGAAQRSYLRRNWVRLNPDFDPSILESDRGIEQTVSVINRLLLDRVKRSMAGGVPPKTVFVSVARPDAAMGAALKNLLQSKGLEALMGDNILESGQMVPAAIEQGIRSSDVMAVLWSRAYAQSVWCYDELSLALSLEALGIMKIWLFNLDDSPIVPTRARKLAAVSIRTSENLRAAVAELLR
ncbi:TIR domain-containing protein [uncultured Roseibium sp.]|uniref:TIR domain-containing protein n=1 Tax=uncultured Roseibium sp. TaxID=1936171 RepID=UPI0032168C6D